MVNHHHFLVFLHMNGYVSMLIITKKLTQITEH